MNLLLLKLPASRRYLSDGGGDGAGGGGGGSAGGDGGGEGSSSGGTDSGSDSGGGFGRGGEDGAGGFAGGFNGAPDAGFSGGPADGNASGYNGGVSTTGLSFSGFLDTTSKALGYVGKGFALAAGGLPGIAAAVSLASDANRGGLFSGLSSQGPSSQTGGFSSVGGGADFSYNKPIAFSSGSSGVANTQVSIPVTETKAPEAEKTPADEATKKSDVTDPSSGGVTASGWDWFKIVGGLASAVAIYKGLS